MALYVGMDPSTVAGVIHFGRPDLDGITDWPDGVEYNDHTARQYWIDKGQDGPPTASITDSALLPCPFCGGTRLARVAEYVACLKCEATGPMKRAGFDLVAVWNAAPRSAITDGAA